MATGFVVKSSHSFDSTTLDSTIFETPRQAWTAAVLDYLASGVVQAEDLPDADRMLATGPGRSASWTMPDGVELWVESFDYDPDDLDTGMCTMAEGRRYGWDYCDQAG